ncbi:MAG: SDR family oxidoreductase [Methylococcaceae bacterium]|jgi:NAD(P)-dependent dehydrogenase (short-subunit alcohol dehydrogenase family)
MATVLITGANRGLGLEFCRQYAAVGWQVIACCREPGQALALYKLSEQYTNIQIEALDVGNFGQIDALSQKLATISLDVLINNAGIYADKRGNGFGALDYQAWTTSFLINSQAPLKMAEAFLPQVLRSEKKLIVGVSSLMGSMADNTSGGSMLYRSSKAALNSALKSLALELKAEKVGVIIFHPGWVKTDMGGANALIEADECITGMRAIIEQFTLAQTGGFIKYDGKVLPW